MDNDQIRDADEPTSAHETGEQGLENEPMMPPGEDSKDEDAAGIPLKSIADEVDGSEETEDMTDVESDDA